MILSTSSFPVHIHARLSSEGEGRGLSSNISMSSNIIQKIGVSEFKKVSYISRICDTIETMDPFGL